MIRWAMVISALMSASALAESYICIEDQSVGFRYDKATDKWEGEIFKASNTKYVYSKSSRTGGWEIKVVGKSYPEAKCDADFNKAGLLICADGFTQFRMNKNNGRYLAVSPIGYWSDIKKLPKNASPIDYLFLEGQNTPYIEIGKCSPM